MVAWGLRRINSPTDHPPALAALAWTATLVSSEQSPYDGSRVATMLKTKTRCTVPRPWEVVG